MFSKIQYMFILKFFVYNCKKIILLKKGMDILSDKMTILPQFFIQMIDYYVHRCCVDYSFLVYREEIQS